MEKVKSFAIVVSQFNQHITQPLLDGAQSRLMERGIDKKNIFVATVPGAIEIPFTAQRLAQKKSYQAIICLGAVIRGDTDHYHYVCEQVSYGCQTVMLKYDIPVIFGVLTTHDEQQALDRIGGIKGHLGKDAADTAIHMATLVNAWGESDGKSILPHAQSVWASTPDKAFLD